MPVAALRYCPGAPTCGVKVPAGAYCPAHTKSRPRRNQDVRKWYATARWFRLRDRARERNPLCVACQASGIVEVWTELDHIEPHRGDPVLFWDEGNLQGLCSRHHGEKTRQGL